MSLYPPRAFCSADHFALARFFRDLFRRTPAQYAARSDYKQAMRGWAKRGLALRRNGW